MSIANYVIGVVMLILIAAPPAAAGVLARRRWSTGWDGATAVLADLVAALCGVILTAEAVGAFGGFRRAPLIVAGFVVLAIVWALAHLTGRRATAAVATTTAPRGGAGRSPATAPTGTDPASGGAPLVAATAAGDTLGTTGAPTTAPWWRRVWVRWLAFAVAAVVVAQWVERTVEALGAGVTESDSVAYHLSVAARFYQSGHLLFLNYIIIDPLHAFHPFNSELLQGIGMVAFRHDVLAPVLNLGWMALLLLAGWCVGRRRGVAPLTLLATVVVIAAPAMVLTGPGAATSDGAAAAGWVAALALLLESDRSPSMLALAGLAAGLGVGAKLTVLAPVLLAAVLVWLVLVKGRRLAGTVTFVVAAVVSGGFWYLRNLLKTGNPLPSLDLGLLPSPDFPIVDKFGYSITDYLTSSHVWRSVFVPGMRESLGDTVWLLVALLVVGLVLALLRGDRLVRCLAVLAILAGIAYAATPLTAYGPKGEPQLIGFVANLRYVLPAVVVGLIAGILVLARWSRRLKSVAAVLLAATAVGMVVPIAGFPEWRPRVLAIVVVLEAVVAAGVWLWLHPRWRPPTRAVVAAAAVLAVLAGGVLAPRFVRRRYAHAGTPVASLGTWAEGLHDQRIAIDRYPSGYLLTGADLSNTVRFLAERVPHGGIEAIPTCAAWRHALDAGHYTLVVVGPRNGFLPEPYAAWTASSPRTKLVVKVGTAAYDTYSVFALTGRLGTDGCPT